MYPLLILDYCFAAVEMSIFTYFFTQVWCLELVVLFSVCALPRLTEILPLNTEFFICSIRGPHGSYSFSSCGYSISVGMVAHLFSFARKGISPVTSDLKKKVWCWLTVWTWNLKVIDTNLYENVLRCNTKVKPPLLTLQASWRWC